MESCKPQCQTRKPSLEDALAGCYLFTASNSGLLLTTVGSSQVTRINSRFFHLVTVKSMTLTVELNLHRETMNQHAKYLAKYLGQSYCPVIVHTHTHTH